MMRAGLFVALVICLVLASGAWAAGGNARLMGMSAAIAVVDDAAAWSINPAALARLNVLPAAEGKEWASDLEASWANIDDVDALAIDWAGWNQEANLGFGAGYYDLRSDSKAFGAGIGKPLGDKWAAGLNFEYFNSASTGAVTFNGGLLYDFNAAVRGGVTVEDIAGRFDVGPFVNAGLAAKINPRLLVAVDVYDLTDEVDVTVNGGAEYLLNDAIALRAGAVDNGDGHDLSVGAGWAYRCWRVDGAYVDCDEGEWAVTVGHKF